jgi:hypothetical protein
MKVSLIVVTILTITQVFSQIPNSSFEYWEQNSTWEFPSGWITNNINFTFVSVTKVDSLTNGDFAMKVESKGASFEGFAPGYALCTFISNNSFDSLGFSYRIDSIESDANIEVIVSQLNGSKYQQVGYWTTNQVTSGIEILRMPIVLINTDSIKLEVRANSILMPTGWEGHAEIIVDNMNLGLISSIKYPAYEDDIILYPNPSNGFITVEDIEMNIPYQLCTLDGKVIKFGILTDKTIEIQNTGVFILKLKIKDNWISKKIVVE